MGWPPLIPMNYKGYKIGLAVNIKAWILVGRPYKSTLKYQDYKKDANKNVHVKLFNATIRINGKTF
jgi:hypothetical protein